MGIISSVSLSNNLLLDISWLPDARAVWAIVGGVVVLLLTQYLRRKDPVKNKIAEDAYHAIRQLDKELTETTMVITTRSNPTVYLPVKYRNISEEVKRIAEQETRLILGGRFAESFIPMKYQDNMHIPERIKVVLKKFRISNVEMTEDTYKMENDYLIFAGNTAGISGIGEGEAYKSVKTFVSNLEELHKAIDKWIAKYK